MHVSREMYSPVFIERGFKILFFLFIIILDNFKYIKSNKYTSSQKFIISAQYL